MARALREVVYIDGARTAFGKAAPDGLFSRTRADDMVVKIVRELLRRHPSLPPERIGDVIVAATAQVGDQGLTLGRDVALLAGLPHSVPGFAVDRMCAGALTATTAGAGEIAMGACDVVIAGGVEHMGHHPMGAEVDFNPRFVAERLIDESAAVMGKTAENLHDVFPQITKERADTYAVDSQRKAAAAWADGVMDRIVVPMSVFGDEGWPWRRATSSCARRRRSRPRRPAHAVPRRRARHGRQLGRPDRRRHGLHPRGRGRRGRRSGSSRRCASSGSRTRASSRT